MVLDQPILFDVTEQEHGQVADVMAVAWTRGAWSVSRAAPGDDPQRAPSPGGSVPAPDR